MAAGYRDYLRFLLGWWSGASFERDSPATVTITARDCGLSLPAKDTGLSLTAKGELTLMATRCTWAGRWVLKIGEVRRPSIDFADMDELEEGDTLTGTPTVEIEAGSGITISNEAVSGTEGAFWADCTAAVLADGDSAADGGNGYTDYEVTVACDTAGGATLKRSATLRLEE